MKENSGDSPLKDYSYLTAKARSRFSDGLIALLLSLTFPVSVGIFIAAVKISGNGFVIENAPLFLLAQFGSCVSVLLAPFQVFYIVKGIRSERSVLAWLAIAPASTVWLYVLWAVVNADR